MLGAKGKCVYILCDLFCSFAFNIDVSEAPAGRGMAVTGCWWSCVVL